VHKIKCLLLCRTWWKRYKHAFAGLKDFGVDGFEIYNCRYRNFRKDDCKALINSSKENKFLMFGVID
jgi:hypothetical protein